MAKSMLGFDFGACELKIAQLNGKKIKRLVSEAMPENMVREGVIVSYDAMGDFIKETLKANKLGGGEAAVILPQSMAFISRITMPAMTEDQLAVNLPYEFHDFLTEAKDKYFYDYAVNELRDATDDDGNPTGKVLDITAAAVSKKVIEDYRDMFRRAGLRLKIAVPIEIAYSNVIRAHGDYEGKEACILDLGHTATRLSIYTGDVFETFRDVEVSLDELEQAISEALGVDPHVARTYKETNYNNCQNAEGAMNIYNAIAADVRKAINFYSFNNRESQLKDIYVCGGGINILPYVQVLKTNLEDMNFHRGLDIMPAVPDGIENAVSFMGAVGAAIE